MKKLLKPLTFLILLTYLTSCVAIKSGKYSAIKSEDLKISSNKKSKIFINWGFYNIKNLPQNVVGKIVSDQKKFFSEVIKESECCEITNKNDEANIFVEGKFYNESSASIYGCFISGLTFTIIPCWANSKMRVTATANKGKMTKDYDIKDSVFIAFWAPLILATPFINAITVEAEVNKNLYKTLLSQMKKDGFFGK